MLGFNGGLTGAKRTTTTESIVPGVWTASEQVLARQQRAWPSPKDRFIVIASANTPYVVAYRLEPGVGIGEKVADPTTLPSGSRYGARISPAGDAVIVTGNIAPRIDAYQFTRDGFGAKFADPSTTITTGTTKAIDFHPTEDAIVVNRAEFLRAYAFSSTSGFGAQIGSDVDFLSGAITDAQFSRDGNYVAAGNDAGASNAYRLAIYSWDTSTGITTRLSFLQSTNTAFDYFSVDWHPTDDFLLTGYGGTGAKVRAYPVTSGVWGTVIDPTTYPSSYPSSVKWTHDGNYALAARFTAAGGGSELWAYPWDSSTYFGTPVTQATSIGNLYDMCIDADDSMVIAVGSGAPYIEAYEWTGSGFGSQLANPTTVPIGGTAIDIYPKA